MNKLLLVFLSLSVSGSLLAGFLFALGPVVRRRLSETWQYYIWLVVILRFLLPFSPETNMIGGITRLMTSPVTASSGSAAILDPGIVQEVPGDALPPPIEMPQYGEPGTDPVPEAPRPGFARQVFANLWALWLGVALMLFVRKAASYQSFARFIRLCGGTERITDKHILELYHMELAAAKIKRGLPLYRNDQVSSPMLIGMLRPALVLPALEASDDELRGILRHELTHCKRLDFLYKWLVQITLCLHWFNPLVYVIARRINKNCELSCDEAVVRSLDKSGRITYGNALLVSLTAQGGYSDFTASMTMSEDGKAVKERLDMIMRFQKRSVPTSCVAALLAVALLCGSVFAGAYQGSRNAPLQESEYGMFEAVKLTVESCNVIVRVSDDGEPRYEYDPKRYSVLYDYKPSPDRDSLHASISVKKIDGGMSAYADMPVIYLPGASFADFTVEGVGAGVSLPELDANLHLTSRDGSMSVSIPAGFDKTIDFASDNGSGALVISEGAKDYLLEVTSDGSAVAVSPEFPAFTPNRVWRYQNGNGAAKIRLDLEGSSFSIASEPSPGSVKEETSAPTAIEPAERERFDMTYDIKPSEGGIYSNPAWGGFSVERIAQVSFEAGQTLSAKLSGSGKEGFMLLCTDKDSSEEEIIIPLQGLAGIPKPDFSKADEDNIGTVFNFKRSSASPDGSASSLEWAEAMQPGTYWFYLLRFAPSTAVTGSVSRVNADLTIDGIVSWIDRDASVAVSGKAEPSNAVDAAALSAMEFSRSWAIVEYLLPNMTKAGIENVVALNNRLNPNALKAASDYKDIEQPTQSGADSRACQLMQLTGNWSYASPLFSSMSDAGIDAVVALYNQKTGSRENASDYYN